MNPILTSCTALALAFGLAGCAGTPAPRTAVMGGPPACDVSISVGSDRGCVVRHMAPVQEETLLTNGLRVQGSSPMTR
ncbi:hypothetical protein [Ramlibacter sp. PS4R-6]|uniref:hypothetical protein n=1 Tax=Ramlibacter sp. PS4R-6 TaxID=3133438 RepID=UPI0030B74355